MISSTEGTGLWYTRSHRLHLTIGPHMPYAVLVQAYRSDAGAVTVTTLRGGIDLLSVPAAAQVAGHTFERLGKKDL